MEQTLLQKHEEYIARVRAKGAKILSYDCPNPECGKAVEVIVPENKRAGTWDTSCTCPHCGDLQFKIATYAKVIVVRMENV